MRTRFAPVLPLVLALAGAALAFSSSAGCGQLPGMDGAAAADTTRAPGMPPPGEGLVTVATDRSVSAAAEQLKSALRSSGASVVADIDHAAHAGGDSLRPTRLLMFGSPQLGTPLMRSVRTAGLDLPQKILIWEGADDSTRVTYNAPSYLTARHEVAGVGSSLNRMGGALADLAEQAAGRVPDTTAFNADSIAAGGGLAIEISDFGVAETYERLEQAMQSRAGLSIRARLDHAQNAPVAADGDSLPPTRLLVLGNLDAGTPLMRKAPTMGIDLPQKMLVWESDDDNTFVSYNEPAYLARRHQLADTTGLDRIAQTLDALVRDATSDEDAPSDR
jgi:uncharacterized protein (DUF302 family)